MDANKFPGWNDFTRILTSTDDSVIESLLNEADANDSSVQHGAAIIGENHALGAEAEAPKFVPHDEQPLLQEEADIDAEIAQCKRRLERLQQLKKCKGVAVEPCKSEESAHQRKISGAQGAFRKNMEDLMDSGGIDGYVYAILPKEGKPRIGYSESLRWWWRDMVNFDREGPAAVAKFKAGEASVLGSNEMIPEPVAPDRLLGLPDNVLGSLLSSLTPHCNPPQRRYPLDKEISPPWWPTGGEQWWHQLEILKNLGPPPYKKTHDLKKAWKISVLISVIKHMIPDIGKLVRLVRQCRCLHDKMLDKKVHILLGVIHREARLYMQEHPGVELPLLVLREGQGGLTFIDDNNSDLVNGRGSHLKEGIQEFQHPNMSALSMSYPQMMTSGFGSRVNQPDTTVSGLDISAAGQQVVGSVISFYNHRIRHGGSYLYPGEIHPAVIRPMPQRFNDASNDGNSNAAIGSSSNAVTMNDTDAIPARMEELPEGPDSMDWFI